MSFAIMLMDHCKYISYPLNLPEYQCLEITPPYGAFTVRRQMALHLAL